MIEKFADVRGIAQSEFLDLNHTSVPIPMFACLAASVPSERH
jgi:hypothetical protein